MAKTAKADKAEEDEEVKEAEAKAGVAEAKVAEVAEICPTLNVSIVARKATIYPIALRQKVEMEAIQAILEEIHQMEETGSLKSLLKENPVSRKSMVKLGKFV